jgi:ribosomal protein S27AE
MTKIKAYYYDYDENEVKIQKSFIVEVFSCPHCQGTISYLEADLDRASCGCLDCGYQFWVNSDGTYSDDI